MFTLPNKLQVLLIQDNNQKELEFGEPIAYVSLAVNVGSFNDPLDRQGLAHFLEHMIFMGSKKYTEQDSYSNHISESGGFTNAYTQLEWTNYHFDVNYSGLQKALDMMANNFHKPLLLKEAMDREINSIDSEFQMVYSDDNTRMLQILMQTCHTEDHIFNRFMWGNLKSLKGQ